eukprot:SAG11_NODE_825_length_6992_cov_2.298564_8_plen_81_part_00
MEAVVSAINPRAALRRTVQAQCPLEWLRPAASGSYSLERTEEALLKVRRCCPNIAKWRTSSCASLHFFRRKWEVLQPNGI